MRRTRLVLLLLLAAFLAVEPVVHSHPLVPGTNSDGGGISNPNLCAICAVGTSQIVVAAPVLVAPAVMVECLAMAPVRIVSAVSCAVLPSRAPPAA